MQIRIFRHFITVGTRQIHYRRAGLGTPVMVLHQSPTSSRECEPIIRRLAPQHSVFAPDMPGYGVSDAADAPLSIDQLADDLAAFMDVLGIKLAGIYGFHTGASVANAFARRHPGRVSVAVLVGLLCLNPSEREDLLQHYLPPFEPRWDGSHLAWLWSRLKDQTLFFPWYARTAAARLNSDGASAAVIQANLRDWLRCGEGYANAYRAAFHYRPEEDLPHIGTPHFVSAFSADPLSAHLGRLPLPRGEGEIRRFTTPVEAESAACDWLSRYLGSSDSTVCEAAPPPQRSWQEYLQIAGLQLRVVRAGQAALPPLLLIHGAQSSATAWTGLIEALGHFRSVFALELPGHGESDALPNESDYSVERLAELVSEAIQILRLSRLELMGIEAGAAIQLAVAVRGSVAVTGLSLLCAIDVAAEATRRDRLLESYSTEVLPDFFGGHLLRAWHQSRDHLLFFPWYERSREHGTVGEASLDSRYVHRQAVDNILASAAGYAVRRAEVRFALAAHLAEARCPTNFAAPNHSPRFKHTQSVAFESGHRFVELPRASEDWAAAIMAPREA